MTSRKTSVLALLLGAVILERIAYFSLKTGLPLFLRQQGASDTSFGLILMAAQAASVVGLILGGAGAYRYGPFATAAMGTALSALGHCAIAIDAPTLLGLSLVSIGGGTLSPCLVLAAAELLVWKDSDAPPSPYHITILTAFAIILSLTRDIGGFLGPLFSGIVSLMADRPTLRILQTVLMFGAAALSAGAYRMISPPAPSLSQAGPTGPYRKPSAPSKSKQKPVGFPMEVLGLMLVVLFSNAVGHAPSLAMRKASLGPDTVWLVAVQPFTYIVTAVIALAGLREEIRKRSNFAPLFLYGAGSLVIALGMVIELLNAGGSNALTAFQVALIGIGLVASDAVPMAYAALALHRRWAVLAVVAWIIIERGIEYLLGLLGMAEGMRLPLVMLSAPLGICAGVLLVKRSARVYGELFPASMTMPDASEGNRSGS